MAGSPLLLSKKLFVGLRDEAPPWEGASPRDFPAVGVAHSSGRGAFTRAAGSVNIQSFIV